MKLSSILKSRAVLSVLAALLMITVLTGAAFAQGGVNVERARALLVELSATVNQNLTVGADVSVGDDLTVADDVSITGDATIGGVITGNVLQYPTPGIRQVCGSTTITGTGTIPTGLATPQYIVHSLAADATGNQNVLSHTNVAATVTIKVWNSALTPAAATTPIAVDWCAIGVP